MKIARFIVVPAALLLGLISALHRGFAPPPRVAPLPTSEAGAARSVSELPGGRLPVPAIVPEPVAIPPREAMAALADWQRRWETSEPAATGELLAEGRMLAKARSKALLDLMRANPDEALGAALSWGAWAALPPEIRELVEQPFSLTGDYEVGTDCRPMPVRLAHPQHLTWLQTPDGPLKVHPSSAWRSVTSKRSLPVQGIRIGEEAVLRSGVVQVLDAPDAAAVAALLPSRPGDEGGPVSALAGGERITFPDEGSATEIADALNQALAMNGPDAVSAGFGIAYSSSTGKPSRILAAASTAALSWSATPKRVLGLRVRFTDAPNTPYATAAAYQANLATASGRLNAMSYGKVQLNITVTPTVLALPGTAASYEGKQDQLNADAKAAAQRAGFTLANYDIFIYSSPPVPNAGPNVSAPGEQNVYSNAGVPVLIHELGHNLGLPHANFWVGTLAGGDWLERKGYDSTWGPAPNDEYGDVFDVMAVETRQAPGSDKIDLVGDFSMDSKTFLGWIDPAAVTEATTTGVYRVHRFDHPNAAATSANKLALNFLTEDGNRVWVGLRRNFANNPLLSTGAYVVWAPRVREHQQIDCTPLSRLDPFVGVAYDDDDLDREDSALPVGMSWTTPDGSVRLTNLGTGGTAPQEYLDLRVEFMRVVPAAEFFTTQAATSPGLTGSYYNETLRSVNEPDWTVSRTRTGVRIDNPPNFPNGASWGARAPLGLTSGTDAEWHDFSVQWDGYLRVGRAVRIASRSKITGSRLWVDANRNGTFEAAELADNAWGTVGQASTGQFSKPLAPGMYKIRAQYEEGLAEPVCEFVILEETTGNFELFQDQALANPGLNARYVNSSLRGVTSQADWATTQAISGSRAEAVPLYWDSPRGARAPVGVTGGTDGNWANFSVQYDGWVRVKTPTRFLTYGSDGSRFWIDLDGNGNFGTSAPEYDAGNWGQTGRQRFGPFSDWVQPGTYRVRIQSETGTAVNNRWAFMGQNAEQTTAGRGIALARTGYLDVPPKADQISGAFTVEAWIRPRHATDTLTFFSTTTANSDYGFVIKLTGGNRVLGHIGNGSRWLATDATANVNYRAGEWMHVAYSVGLSSYTIYINGLKAGTGSGMGNEALLTKTSHPISIGREGRHGQEFDGDLEEVRIWHFARTAEEIAANFHRRARGDEPNLVACWHLDETEGAGFAADAKGFWNARYNGTVNKTALASPVFDVFDAASYRQNFDALANGARETGDGASLESNNRVTRVVGFTNGNKAALLTDAETGSTLGRFVLPRLYPSVYGFLASFRYQIQKPPASPAADGFSFNLKPAGEPVDESNQVGGYARGLGVEFITFGAPRHQVRVNNTVLPGASTVSPAIDQGWIAVEVEYHTAPGETGRLTVRQNGVAILTDVPVDYASRAGDVFAFTARTIGYAENVFIDDVVVTPLAEKPLGRITPAFVSRSGNLLRTRLTWTSAPGARYDLHSSRDLLTWRFERTYTATGSTTTTDIISSTATDPHQFFRVVPQP